MTNLKKITKELRQEIVSYLLPFPSITSNLAFRLATLIFAKTRFCSHIRFIGQCLKSNVIPKGFQTTFHASKFSISSGSYLADIQKSCTGFSKNIMRSTIRAMSTKRNQLDRDISACRSELERNCPAILVQSIRSKIRELNSKIHHCLQQTKSNKFVKLTGAHSSTNTRDPPNTVVTIPSDLPLTAAEKSVLSKGLNFVPLQKKSDEFSAKFDTEQFFRRVQLKAFFHDKQNSGTTEKDEFESLAKRKSNWTPPEGEFGSVDLFIRKCRHDIRKLNFGQTIKFSNLTADEWAALKSFRNRKDVTIKPADKGGAVVVWRTDLYKQEAARQLADSKFYVRTEKDLTLDNQKIVKTTINELISNRKLPPTARNLVINTPRTSHIYFLPKIHKTNNPGRPIVSACSCPTELISSFLDKKMASFVQSLPTYIKDTNHALKIFDQFQFPAQSKLVFTMDVKSLYTVIPNDEGLRALRHFFDRRTVKEPSTDTLIRLAELVLTLNCFSFDAKFYRQINGVAMGTKMGPNYANLFVGYVEEQIFDQFDGPAPELFGRYIDDCFGATSCSRPELDRFIQFVNTFHPALEFTWEISTSSVTFLDINVSIQNNGLATSVHYKPTDSHSYLLHSSSHPPHVKNSIPYSQFLRLRRLCSDDTDFSAKADEMRNFFAERNYPNSVVTDALERVHNISRETALKPSESKSEDRIPLTITYHPNNLRVKDIILKNFKLLQSDPDTATIFEKPPLVSFKRDKSLRNSLVKGSLSTEREPGTFKCSRKRCNTCPFIANTISISGPKNSTQITDHFDCTSRNVIYCIRCTACNQLYIGETGRRLGDRFREHLLDVKNNSQDVSKPVARHFNQPGHSHNNMTIFGLSLHQGNTESRKCTEQRLIFKIGTLSPAGINERFSFS